MVWWSMREEPWRKMGLQHTTTVWYSGSCINKCYKLTDTVLPYKQWRSQPNSDARAHIFLLTTQLHV